MHNELMPEEMMDSESFALSLQLSGSAGAVDCSVASMCCSSSSSSASDKGEPTSAGLRLSVMGDSDVSEACSLRRVITEPVLPNSGLSSLPESEESK